MFDFSYKKVSKKSSQSSRKAINVNSIFSFDTGRRDVVNPIKVLSTLIAFKLITTFLLKFINQ